VKKYEQALVKLANGSVDEDVWREIASASPSTFHYWANSFPELATPSSLESCWRDVDFREAYRGDRTEMNKHVETFHGYTQKDFEGVENVAPYTNPKSAKMLAEWYKEGRWSRGLSTEHTLRLLSEYPSRQIQVLRSTYEDFTFTLPAKVVTKYLETTMYNGWVIPSLISSHTDAERGEWAPTKYKDPVTAYLFGSERVLRDLDGSDLRHLGYLSFYNLRAPQWHMSFKRWLTRHGAYEKKLLRHFRAVEVTRDLTDIDEDFFTPTRLAYLDRLMGQAKSIKLRVPSFIAIKIKEQILMNESEYRNLEDRVLAGVTDA
jgi:hypothetical protein